MNCAWCGANDDHSDSHGICQSCADRIELESKMRAYNRTPSYVEVQATLAAEEWERWLAEQMEVIA